MLKKGFKIVHSHAGQAGGLDKGGECSNGEEEGGFGAEQKLQILVSGMDFTC